MKCELFVSYASAHKKLLIRGGTEQPGGKDVSSSGSQLVSVLGHPVLPQWTHGQSSCGSRDEDSTGVPAPQAYR